MSDSQKIKLGDHLSRVANEHGFRSFEPLWDEPANLPLRRQRGTPHILAQDDTVVVPELNLREVDRAVDQRHRFRAEIHPLVVRLRRLFWDREPVDDPPVTVELDGRPTTFKTAAGGQVEFPVTSTTDRCRLDEKTHELTVRVGFLQAADTVAGFRERLNNLGYDAGSSDDPLDLQIRSAVEEFQCDEGLVVDGKVGPNTRAILVKVHGC